MKELQFFIIYRVAGSFKKYMNFLTIPVENTDDASTRSAKILNGIRDAHLENYDKNVADVRSFDIKVLTRID